MKDIWLVLLHCQTKIWVSYKPYITVKVRLICQAQLFDILKKVTGEFKCSTC